MSKKIFVVVLVVVAVLIAGFLCWRYMGAEWWQVKQHKIALGLANPNFPWFDRSEAELAKLYPQVKNADVPTRVTPEETYAKFRQGLKENNLDLVLAQLSVDSSRYDSNVTAVRKAFAEGKFAEIFGKYPEKITESWTGDTISQYNFVEFDSDYLHMIEFKKNADGVWEIDIY
ncbi:MAG: hypothetical protein PHD72_02430 [Patescibacteria group bacterium]|nr:hypothetical protein [Patescibacteria group bacterium]